MLVQLKSLIFFLVFEVSIFGEKRLFTLLAEEDFIPSHKSMELIQLVATDRRVSLENVKQNSLSFQDAAIGKRRTSIVLL